MSIYIKAGSPNWAGKDWYKSDYYYARLEEIRKKKQREPHVMAPLNIIDV